MERNSILVLGWLALACAAVDTRGAVFPLEKTHWTLVSLGAGSEPVAKTQTEAFLVFGDPPGHVSGSGGCNRMTGPYEQNGEKLTFGPIAATRMACADGMQVEDGLGTALASTASFRIEGDRLELRDKAGSLLAGFEAH